MIQSIIALAEIALRLWASMEKRKYQDKLLGLKRKWRDEWNKPKGERSNAVLDNIEFEIRLLCDGIVQVINNQDENSNN